MEIESEDKFNARKKQIIRGIEARWPQFRKNRCIAGRTSEDIASDVILRAIIKEERPPLSLFIYRARNRAYNAVRMQVFRDRVHKQATEWWMRRNDRLAG